METLLFRLADVGSADPYRLLYDLFDMLLRPLLYIMELVDNPLQSIASYMLEVATVLGFTICRYLDVVVFVHGCYDYLGTSLSRLESCVVGAGVDVYHIQTEEDSMATIL